MPLGYFYTAPATLIHWMGREPGLGSVTTAPAPTRRAISSVYTWCWVLLLLIFINASNTKVIADRKDSKSRELVGSWVASQASPLTRSWGSPLRPHRVLEQAWKGIQ